MIGAGLLGLGAVAAVEARAVARLVLGADPGGRLDHASSVGSGLGEPLQLLLLGDSAVDGYGLGADESLPRQLAIRVANATGRRVQVRSVAVSGATTADVARLQIPLLRAAGRVDAVYVGVGVNDALRRTPVGALEDATRALVAGLDRAAPEAAVVFAPCFDLGDAPGLAPVLRRLVGWRSRHVAATQRAVLEGLGVPTLRAEGPIGPAGYGADGLHPGAEGVQRIAELACALLVAEPSTAPA